MLNIKKELIDEIKVYCKINKIENVENFINNLIEKAFTIEKYGSVPKFIKNVDKKENNNENNKEKKVFLPTQNEIKEPIIKLTNKKPNDDYEVYDEF